MPFLFFVLVETLYTANIENSASIFGFKFASNVMQALDVWPLNAPKKSK